MCLYINYKLLLQLEKLVISQFEIMELKILILIFVWMAH